jgi:hypothetical protein
MDMQSNTDTWHSTCAAAHGLFGFGFDIPVQCVASSPWASAAAVALALARSTWLMLLALARGWALLTAACAVLQPGDAMRVGWAQTKR